MSTKMEREEEHGRRMGELAGLRERSRYRSARASCQVLAWLLAILSGVGCGILVGMRAGNEAGLWAAIACGAVMLLPALAAMAVVNALIDGVDLRWEGTKRTEETEGNGV